VTQEWVVTATCVMFEICFSYVCRKILTSFKKVILANISLHLISLPHQHMGVGGGHISPLDKP